MNTSPILPSSQASEDTNAAPSSFLEQISHLQYQLHDDAHSPYWTHKLYRGPQGKLVKVSYCTTLAESEAAAQKLLGVKVLGFDLEWRPAEEKDNPWTTIGENVSMIQLASQEEICLFHIALHDGALLENSTVGQLLAPTLEHILKSADIVKVGKLAVDVGKLVDHLKSDPNGCLDVARLARSIGHGKIQRNNKKGLLGLPDMIETIFHLQLDKTPRISDWSIEITESRKDYAATDAYAGLMLFHEMNNTRLQMVPPPPIPRFHKCPRQPKKAPDGNENAPAAKRPRKSTTWSSTSPLFKSNRTPKGKKGKQALPSSQTSDLMALMQPLSDASFYSSLSASSSGHSQLDASAASPPRLMDSSSQLSQSSIGLWSEPDSDVDSDQPESKKQRL